MSIWQSRDGTWFTVLYLGAALVDAYTYATATGNLCSFPRCCPFCMYYNECKVGE